MTQSRAGKLQIKRFQQFQSEIGSSSEDFSSDRELTPPKKDRNVSQGGNPPIKPKRNTKSDQNLTLEKSPKHECHDDLLSLQSIDSNIKNIMRSPYDIRQSDKMLKTKLKDAKVIRDAKEEEK